MTNKIQLQVLPEVAILGDERLVRNLDGEEIIVRIERIIAIDKTCAIIEGTIIQDAAISPG